MSLDWFFVFLSEFSEFAWFELTKRSVFDWLLFFMPLVLFFEFPRYYLPLFVLLIARRLGLPRRDRRAEDAFLDQGRLVSVVIAGRNEAATIGSAIESLLDQNYPNLEIIIVDDSSDDDMYGIVRRYARQGRVRLIRNNARRGRAGRPVATNLGVRVANGEFIVSLDADTTFDRDMIRNILRPFVDPRVGVVAGTVKPRNPFENLLTQLQTIEYALAIDMRKRWTDLFGCTLQASGAIGAFRRQAVMELGNWDPELAEDADISLRMIKQGWRLAYAPGAQALTVVPTKLKTLIGQRTRWDRGGLRMYVKKHWRVLDPRVGGWVVAQEMWGELIAFLLSTVLFPFYLVWLAFQGLFMALFVLGISFVIALISAKGRPITRPTSLITLLAFSAAKVNPPPTRRSDQCALPSPLPRAWAQPISSRPGSSSTTKNTAGSTKLISSAPRSRTRPSHMARRMAMLTSAVPRRSDAAARPPGRVREPGPRMSPAPRA